ncbi:MAG: arginine decarboxylase, partial [Desulfovibrionaceae bacterium]|nr:arginine decarboxylase [Desulfovibrionaceae bacterium]
MVKKDTLERWNAEKSAELYNIRNWSAGYFDVSREGHVVITPSLDNKKVRVSIPRVIKGLRERGLDMPVLLRVENILDSQISHLHEAFRAAMERLSYRNVFRGVFPIKVNQQEQVIE